MEIKLKICLITTLLLSTLAILPNHNYAIMASVVHYEENFDDNDVSDWSTSIPCSPRSMWETKYFGDDNYAYGIRIEDNGCRMFTKSPSEHINANQNYVYDIDVYVPEFIRNDLNITFEYRDPQNLMSFYSVGRSQRNLYRLTDGHYELLDTYDYELTPQVWHHIKIVKIQNNYDFYLDGEKFGNYQEDGLLLNDFGIGFRMGNGSNPYSEIWFDNVKLTLLEDGEEPPNDLKQLKVSDYKQYDGGWEADEYDSAENWSTDSTMARWGCAVTSAAMVLDYYGIPADPGSLNDWLKNQDDGYTRNGAVMWPAITRYTKNNGNTLDFAYIGYSDTTFKDEIGADRPPIIKLDNSTYGGNHFIVGTGLTNEDDDFKINDPGSSSNPKLSDANDYWGDSINIGRFKETHTDLSYIVGMLTDGFQMELKKEGLDVGDEYYQEEKPYLNPEDPETNNSGETLQSVWYPKPENGNYSFEVSGSGFYQLDIYYYDKDGNVIMETIYGYLLEGDVDEYNFIFDKENLNRISIHSATDTFLSSMERLCSKKGFIRHGFCQSVISLTRNAVKIAYKESIFTANILLDLVVNRVKINTPSIINPDLSSYILTQINLIKQELI